MNHYHSASVTVQAARIAARTQMYLLTYLLNGIFTYGLKANTMEMGTRLRSHYWSLVPFTCFNLPCSNLRIMTSVLQLSTTHTVHYRGADVIIDNHRSAE